jgi:hypothetical protein
MDQIKNGHGVKTTSTDSDSAWVVAGIGIVAIGMFLTMRASEYVAYELVIGATLLLAGSFGALLDARRGLVSTIALGLLAAAAATTALPDLERQLDDGAFWIGLGWIMYLVFVLVAWAIGAFLRTLVVTIRTARARSLDAGDPQP